MDLSIWMTRYNEWWRTKGVREDLKKERRRELFDKILNHLEGRQILAVTGLRRTGKTTVLYQIIDHLLSEGVPPANILYFSFDEEMAKDPVLLEVVIDRYRDMMHPGGGRMYIFLDEVQYLSGWQAVLKRYYDLDLGLKFFVSGSAGLNIRKAKESLVGRVFEFECRPLYFREFLRLKGHDIPAAKDVFDGDGLAIYEREVFPYRDLLQRMFTEYLRKGGFPEMLEVHNLEHVNLYLRTNLERIIYQDIPSVFKLGEPALLLEILRAVASQTGGVMVFEKLADSFRVTRQTVSNYFLYLDQSFLLHRLTNHTGSFISGTRKAKKYYLADHGLVNVLTGQVDELLSDIYLGTLVETVVVNHLRPDHFWRGKYEVDIILDRDGSFPVEVKYRSHPDNLKGLEVFMKKSGSKHSLVVTKDLFTRKTIGGAEVLFVPAYLLLSGI